MIKNPSFAIAWSMFKGHQKITIGLLASIPLMLLIKLTFSEILPQQHSFSSYKFYSFALLYITIFLTTIFIFAEFRRNFANTAFPNYTFTHPISSFQLAIIPISVGILMTYFYYVCWIIVIVEYQLKPHQFLIVFCCISAGVSWLQMVSWRYNNAPVTSISLMISIFVSIFVLVVTSWELDNPTPLINVNLAYLGLFLLPLSGILLAINSVVRCRTNQIKKQNRFFSNIRLIGFKLPKNYNSISQALFRYEWRVFGWKLPMLGILIVSTLIFIASMKETLFILPLILIISPGLVLTPWIMAADMSKAEPWKRSNKTNGVPSFFASLPVSNIELAMAKLNVIARSIVLSHFIALLTINIFMVVLVDRTLDNPWIFLESQYGGFKGGLILLGANLLYPIIVWILAGNTLAWYLKGLSFFTVRRTSSTIIYLSLLIFIGYNSFHSESFRTNMIDYTPLINGLIFILVTAFFYRALKRFRTVESIMEIKRVIIIALTILAFELVVFSISGLITFSNPHGILTLLSLMLLGIMPFLTSPFSIAMSRAR
jgi:hypothetical protein